jgi:hypothetical protein
LVTGVGKPMESRIGPSWALAGRCRGETRGQRVPTAQDPHVAPLLTPVRDRADYEALVAALDRVLDAGGAEEDRPLGRRAA